ncbi:hypothetical protein [Streptomyces natalensis]|uniref:hypothetical protein n=1 Tax=Streptomyces natalensis TaxID=68242 RepID=UPI0012FE8490|nr:hypothetical protein [Streptomyces natalensis]
MSDRALAVEAVPSYGEGVDLNSGVHHPTNPHNFTGAARHFGRLAWTWQRNVR